MSSGTRFSWKFSGQSYKVFGRKDVDPDTQAVTGGSGANRLRMLF